MASTYGVTRSQWQHHTELIRCSVTSGIIPVIYEGYALFSNGKHNDAEDEDEPFYLTYQVPKPSEGESPGLQARKTYFWL